MFQKSGSAVLISFNPITGSLIERKSFPTSIKRVEILPYANARTHVYHLIMVDKNNKASFICLQIRLLLFYDGNHMFYL